MKKTIILCLLCSFLFGLSGCGKEEYSDSTQKNVTEEDTKKELTKEEQFERAISNFKNSTYYEVKHNSSSKGGYEDYNSTVGYKVDRKNLIVKGTVSGYYDFKNMKYTYDDTGCNSGWFYDYIEEGRNIDNNFIFNYPVILSKEDISNYEDGVFVLNISTDRLKKIGDLNFDYLKLSSLELKVTLENENIKSMEYVIDDSYSTDTNVITYSNFNNGSIKIPKEANKAKYRPLSWQICEDN